MKPACALKVGLVLLLAGSAVALPTSALAKRAAASANSQTYTDSTGEDPAAPDITSIVVSNDDAGLITFKINISNRPTLTADMTVLMFLDTDKQATTGDATSFGADYAIELDPGSVGLFKWNGTTYDPAQSQTSVTYNYDATGATITVSAADLGGARVVNFVVAAVSGLVIDSSGNPDFTNAHIDFAPDSGHGLYKYNVIAKLTLTATAFTTAPKPAKAGKKLTASVAVNESDTNGPVTSATVACVGTIKGVRIPATHTLTSGIASGSWKLPAKAKGKTFLGKITVTVRGTALTKSFSARIT